jgi:diaminohydroxyphosphoribosylaminopyrimidine deaminase / 5-amino-6-(5-phosphoribosylamino)uracil reductase
VKQPPSQASSVPDENEVWALLLELCKRARSGRPVTNPRELRLDPAGQLEIVPAERGWLTHDAEWDHQSQASSPAHELLSLLELYLPLCVGSCSCDFVLGHLGQSLDGQIAAASGASRYVTGPENLRHMHRLRALSDAVLVGASTVMFDDPQLTTRLVPGQNPVRVVIDPMLRVPQARRVFNDGQSRAIVITSTSAEQRGAWNGGSDVIRVPCSDGVLSVHAILDELRRRGLRRLFVEGGGVTVSHFLRAGAFTRLHITVSPVFLGTGRPGIVLPPIQNMGEALRPRVRRFDSGQDVLFDFSFEPNADAASGQPNTRG